MPRPEFTLEEAYRRYLKAKGNRCNVCTGWSPSWDGHDKNPPCETQAWEDLQAVIEDEIVSAEDV